MSIPANTLVVGAQYSALLTILDSLNSTTKATCSQLFEVVPNTAKTLPMSLNDTSNAKNYTNATQQLVIQCN